MAEELWVQLELPGFGDVERVEGFSGCDGNPARYYLVNPHSNEMMGIDLDGRFIWRPHDTLLLQARLFSTRNSAKRIARKYRHSVVRRWKWRKGT